MGARRKISRGILLLLCVAAVAAAAGAGEELPRIAVAGGEVHTLDGRVISEGTVLIAEGRIRAVRKGTRAPGGYTVIDASGMRVYPGLVAAAAEGLGVPSRLVSGETALGIRVSDALDPHDMSLQLASSHGVTTAYVSMTVRPEEGDPFQGTGSVLRVLPGGDPEEMVLLEPAGVHVILTGATRRFELRRALEEAAGKGGEERGRGKEKEDRGREVLKRVLDGEVPLVSAPRMDAGEVLEASELARALGVRLVLDRPTEAWAVADVLAEREVPVIQSVRMGWFKPRDDERTGLVEGWRFDAPARLRRAGVQMAVAPFWGSVSTGGTAGRDVANLAMEAAFAVRGGLTDEEALGAVTIEAARILGIEDRVGTLERGKDADIIVVDGDPLHYRTLVRWTIAGGRVAYDASASPHWRRILERRDEALEGPPAWPDRGR